MPKRQANGANIREVREQRGFSRAELGQAAGIHARTLYRLEERPGATHDEEVFQALADALGCTVDTLMQPAASVIRYRLKPGALRHIRTARRMTLADVAHAAKVNRSTVIRWESSSDHLSVRFENLSRVAAALGCPPSTIADPEVLP